MSGSKVPRHKTPEYGKARTLAEDLDDKSLAATIELLRTMLAAYGDVLFSRRRNAGPGTLATVYQALAECEKKKRGLSEGVAADREHHPGTHAASDPSEA